MSEKYKKTILRKAKENGKDIPDFILRAINNNSISREKTIKFHPIYSNNNSGTYYLIKDGAFNTLLARMGTGGNNVPLVIEEKENGDLQIRKLTPLECCRLQGFPDDWTDNLDDDSDYKRYTLWGNGVALPCVKYVISKIAKMGPCERS